MNKSLLFPIILVAVSGISPTLALALALAKSDVAGGYDTGFARDAEEARAAINEFDMDSPKSIDADKPPPCPLADKQDDFCDGWKDGWRQFILDILD